MKVYLKRLSASKLKLALHSIGALALIVLSSLILYEATKTTVVVAQDGERQTVKTHSNTVGNLFEELGIDVGEHDELSYDTSKKITNGMDIEYKQAKQLLLTIDDVKHEYFTTSKTIENFLTDENINLSKHDQISHDLEDQILEGLYVTVDKAYELTISDGGKEKQVWTTGGTIDQLLAENNIELKKMDKIKPALDKDVQSDTPIKITRVEKETDMVEEDLDYKIEKKEDNSLAKGKEKVVSKGKKGLVVREFQVVKENGKEVSRELVNEETKEDSKKQVVAVGTKELNKNKETNVTTVSNSKSSSSDKRTTNTDSKKSTHTKSTESNSKTNDDGQVMHMEATAYTAGCNGCSGHTATGINLNANPNMKVVAVDPNVIPLGSKVWVEGYGNAIAGDTGGAIKGNRIDAHVPTKADADRFGRKKVKVKVID